LRVEKEISLNLIDMDRIPLDEKTLEFANIIAGTYTYGLAKGSFPPIKVAKLRTGRYVIRDGWHRWATHKLLGREKILAKFSTQPLLKDFISIDYANGEERVVIQLIKTNRTV